MWVPCEEEDSDRLRIDLAQAFENLESIALPVNVEIRQEHVEILRLFSAVWNTSGTFHGG